MSASFKAPSSFTYVWFSVFKGLIFPSDASGEFGPKLTAPVGMNFSADWLQLTPGAEAAGGNVNRQSEGEQSGTEAPQP